MEIMLYVKIHFEIDTWGFLAAILIYEKSNENNKRYQVYKEVLRRSFQNDYAVFGNRKNSAIFVIPTNRVGWSNLAAHFTCEFLVVLTLKMFRAFIAYR
jgi:hypothetical protein